MEMFTNPFKPTETISIGDHAAVERIGRQFYERLVREVHEQDHLSIENLSRS